MKKKLLFVFFLVIFSNIIVYWLTKESNIGIMSLCEMVDLGDGYYSIYIVDRNGEMIFSKHAYRPRVEKVDKETIKVTCGIGDYKLSEFINVRTGNVSEMFENVSIWYNNKVVYASYEKDGSRKIIVQDAYDRNTYYKEIVREFSQIAVPSNIIIEAEFINDKQLRLVYFYGSQYERKIEIIDL